jgi:hypothetical protein
MHWLCSFFSSDLRHLYFNCPAKVPDEWALVLVDMTLCFVVAIALYVWVEHWWWWEWYLLETWLCDVWLPVLHWTLSHRRCHWRCMIDCLQLILLCSLLIFFNLHLLKQSSAFIRPVPFVDVMQGTYRFRWWTPTRTLASAWLSASCDCRRCHLWVVSRNIVYIVSIVKVRSRQRSLVVLRTTPPFCLRLRLVLCFFIFIDSSLLSSIWVSIFLHYVKQLLLCFRSSSV